MNKSFFNWKYSRTKSHGAQRTVNCLNFKPFKRQAMGTRHKDESGTIFLNQILVLPAPDVKYNHFLMLMFLALMQLCGHHCPQ